MIFRLGNTKIKLSFSFVALTVMMILMCNEEIVLCSFLSSFIHECGHLFFMGITGEKLEKIEMSLFGMRISRTEKSSVSYKNEILISLGGIIFNCLFSASFFLIYRITDIYVFMILSAVNIIVAAVNSFPVSALDLGRAVAYTLKYKDYDSLNIRMFSYIFTAVFVILSSLYILTYGVNISLIAINLYLIFITVIKKWS